MIVDEKWRFGNDSIFIILRLAIAKKTNLHNHYFWTNNHCTGPCSMYTYYSKKII